MRYFILSALVIICANLPMGSIATPIPTQNVTAQVNSEHVNPELVEKLLRQVQQDENMEYDQLCKLWCAGKLEITKNPIGYVVTLSTQSGTVIISVIDDL